MIAGISLPMTGFGLEKARRIGFGALRSRLKGFALFRSSSMREIV
jgi:hypothetical protein